MKVEAQDITFGFDDQRLVLENLSFTIEPSCSLAIVGPSGCGKSTLLRLLCGLLPNASTQTFKGHILVDGLDIHANRQDWNAMRSKGLLGFMFQEPSLLANLEVDRNIHLSLEMLRGSHDGESVVASYLQLTGLDQDRDKYPSQLSGGMKTRVALARTFITRPKLLLLDEPFSALDVVWKSNLYQEVKKLRDQMDATVVIVTHDIFEAIYFSNRIMVLGANQSIIEQVSIPNWSDQASYNDVILGHHRDFVYIKQLIEHGYALR